MLNLTVYYMKREDIFRKAFTISNQNQADQQLQRIPVKGPLFALTFVKQRNRNKERLK
jgi:hypothetical protein